MLKRVTLLCAVVAAGSMLVATGELRAQCLRQWQAGEQVPGVNGGVSDVTVLANGDVLVCGQFTVAGGVTSYNIARYNPPLDRWYAVNTVPVEGSGVQHAIELPGGDYIVTGWFSSIGGIEARNIARYNPASGQWSTLGPGIYINSMDPTVMAAPLPDNSVLVAGGVSLPPAAPGEPFTRGVVKYSFTTGLWTPIGTGLFRAYQDPTVSDMAVMPGGDVVISGRFSAIDGVPTSNIARYSVATGEFGPLGAGLLNASSIAALPSGDLLAVGQLTGSGYQPAVLLYSVSAGTWSTMPSVGQVGSVAVGPDGRALVGGNSLSFDGVWSGSILALNPATATWSLAGFDVAPGYASSMAFGPDGTVYVGGGFRSVRIPNAPSMLAASMVRYKASDGGPKQMGASLSGIIRSTALMNDGRVAVVGEFTSAGGNPAQRLAFYNPATKQWTGPANGPVSGSRTAQSPWAVLPLPSGEVVVGGSSYTVAGQPGIPLAKYNPATDLWTVIDSGIRSDGEIYALALLPGGDWAIGGRLQIETPSGTRFGAVRYNPATGQAASLGGGSTDNNAYVRAFCQLSNGSLIASGIFGSKGGLDASNIGQYNPVLNNWTMLGDGTSRNTTSVAEAANGDIFAVADSTPTVRRYRPSTGVWQRMGYQGQEDVSGSFVVTATDGTVYLTLTTSGYTSYQTMARYDQITGVFVGLDGQRPIGGEVKRLLAIGGGDIVGTGDFLSIGEKPSSQIAVFSASPVASTSQPPVITMQPTDVFACLKYGGTVSIAASAATAIFYQWQIEDSSSPDGWTNLRNGYNELTDGRRFNSWDVNTVSMRVVRYVPTAQLPAEMPLRCVVSNFCGMVISAPATLYFPTPCSLADVAGTTSVEPCADGILDGTDFIAFINSFATGERYLDPVADVAGGGPDGLSPDNIIDGSDFIAFINAFSAGC